jgi:hypothetical protein
MPSINAFYWFLTALSTGIYMAMYILLFIAALKLGRPKEAFSYRIPKGFRRLICMLGLLGCAITMVVGSFPPPTLAMDVLSYAMLFVISIVGLISPAFLLCYYKKRKKNQS